MAIVRGLDGKFYEVPDDQLAKAAIPEDKVNERLQKAGASAPPPSLPPPPPPSSGGGAPAIEVHIYGNFGQSHGGADCGPPPGTPAGGEVSPYHWQNHHWQNHHWHNHHWHNWD